MSAILEFFAQGMRGFTIRPRVSCLDGFSMSVQASSLHQCRPKEDGLIVYETVEVGFPSQSEELLLPFREKLSGGRIHFNVPIATIDAVIEKHGGFVS